VGRQRHSRPTFGPELLAPDFDRFAPIAEAAAMRIPMLNEVGIRELINGPIPISADGEPIIGCRLRSTTSTCAAASPRVSQRRAARAG
jgi:glycine/D-amino acid oxidase-like deaminating enzyme